MGPRYLTKSRFSLAVQCPTKLYFADRPHEYKNLKREDSFLQMLADGGFQVGALAKLLYPDGIEITAKDHATAETETKELLKRDSITIFEPAIRHGDLFVRIDILVKRGDSLELIEVKSKSYDSTAPKIVGKRGGVTSEMLPYIIDVAFQTYVLRSACPTMSIRPFLLMPDKSLQTTIDGLNQLFKVHRDNGRTQVQIDPCAYSEGYGDNVLALVNVDQYVEKIMNDGIEYPGGHEFLPELAAQWAESYKADTWIPPTIGPQCAKCEFQTEREDGFKNGFKECWKRANNWTDKDFHKGTVVELWNFHGKDKLIQQGKFKLRQVTQVDLNYKEGDSGLSNSQRQWMQVAGVPQEHVKAGFYLDIPLMKAAMACWKYPYHFIDFETSAVALPFHKGLHPYESVAFQFSHHSMDADGNVCHAGEFLLAEPGVFPNYDFARALKAALGTNNGTVFMWSHHENTILKTIANQLEGDPNVPADKPELVSFLGSLIKNGSRAMVDLKVLSQKVYFHPSTKGSNSIKKVLPSVMSYSGYLKATYSQPIYGALDGIPSYNYKNQVWWVEGVDHLALDPYDLLKVQAIHLLGDEAEEELAAEEFGITEGGAAALAYARLQFENVDEKSRQLIKGALLRYCELDSLAMVMIVQAWQEAITS
jgi:hypothetical protein